MDIFSDLLFDDKRYCVITSEHGHRVLRMSRSNGPAPAISPSTSTAPPQTATTGAGAEFDYDFVNVVVNRPPPAPSLNRFPSFKGASIWRSK